MARFDDRVAFITGAARGQGRSHAIAFAAEGADVVVSDMCQDMKTLQYDLGTQEDLAETVSLCEAEGARVIADRVDVRSYDQLKSLADRTLEEFGRIDIAVANAGIFGIVPTVEQTPEIFGDMIDVNLKGVFHTIRAVLPAMIEQEYGRIIATGSTASLIGHPGVGHYAASKHGVAGLIKTVAREVGDKNITANYVVPNGVSTRMIRNDVILAAISPEDPTEEGAGGTLASMNAIPIGWIQPEDVSRVVLFIASDEARYTTGAAVKVDLGATP